MYTDILGKSRVKLGLHQHSTRSDGSLSPEEVAALYRNAGYDAIALTDHWVYGDNDVLSGLPILAGAEYHVGVRDAGPGIFHILCLFAAHEPTLQREGATAQGIVDAIHGAGGIAVLAHPAWSLNSPESVASLKGIDATEIYNTVSNNTRRADASLLVDVYATNGQVLPLFAADDFHSAKYFSVPEAFIMVEAESLDPAVLKKAVLEERFYASTGPEIHLSRQGDVMVVDCSPAKEIVFESNLVLSQNRIKVGKGLTHAEYPLNPDERFVRAFVTDESGRRAWSNFVKI